jgi:hypothetical protein
MGPQLGTSPAIDAQRAGLRPYQYDALPPNPEMLKNMLAGSAVIDYLKGINYYQAGISLAMAAQLMASFLL